MTRPRKWPTISEILAAATLVEFGDSGWTQYRAGDKWVSVHAATAPNLRKTLHGAGWRQSVLPGRVLYERPETAHA